ncbi:ArpU family phage packaging/lysis transcriptional regulator [Ligilactobacillus ruminis]|uniref:ArpU family phage packaging/lysis transcriptional regulator n=1 Tax=Ligilactobacillus ruminis TaxID=1623 RepID=UPI001897CC3B|nr:ArpU family phage packaging/lysis transcriptional regulator [Ligilactobacillus ruminis]
MDDLLIEIDNIDYKATARNVKEFLDKKLPRILRIANASPASLASPVISDMPVNRGGGNHNEEKMVKYVAAKAIIDGVSRALAHCSQMSSHILKARYVQGLQNWQVIDTMYCERATYYKLRDKAFNEFADCFEMQKGCPDLHVYK